MKRIKLIVKTKSKKYPIIVGENIIKKISNIIKSNQINFENCIIIVDKKVPKKKISDLKNNILCKKKIIHFFNSNEKNKNQENVDLIQNILFKNRFNRDDCLVAFGGGITGDVVGYCASTFKRGIKFINIPTTLLAQVDASVGGKTAINSSYGKNLIGTFYQPDFVLSDISMFKSLPRREIVSGYGEILKHSLILDRNFFFWLLKNGNEIMKQSKKKWLFECEEKKSLTNENSFLVKISNLKKK